ncbi:MAG: NAD-dependent epimerase/dehydratase family protein [Aureliella sp.]
MNGETVLVTGGLGCIGVPTVNWLLRETECKIVVGSRKVTESSLARFGSHPDRLFAAALDVQKSSDVERVFATYPINRIAHLSGLQTPDCNEHRDLGLQVNLAGTQHLIEAAKRSSETISRFIYASSIAVYGPRTHYPEGLVPMNAEPLPVNVYGVWKLASEHITRIFSEETGIPSLSIRPGVLFGPGRDVGLTSTVTTAMKMAAANQPYQIPFSNRQDYLFASDVGAAFGNALIEPFEGYGAVTLPSHTVTSERIAATIREQAKSLGLEGADGILIGDQEVPFICDVDFAPFMQLFPKTPHTPLSEAVRQSLIYFRDNPAAN